MTTRAVKLLLLLALLCPWLAFADGAISVFPASLPATTGTNSGDVTVGAFGSTPNNFGLSLSGQVLSLQPADGTHPGSVNASTQSFGGVKTFLAQSVFSAGLTLGDSTSLAEASGAVTIKGNVSAGSSIIFDNAQAIGGYVGNVYSFRINNVEKVTISNQAEVVAPYFAAQTGYIGQAGTFFRLTGTDSSGTPGAAVQNNSAGILAIAAGQSTVVLTDSVIASSSVVLFSMQGTDATCLYPRAAVPGSGSVTFTVGPAACTGAMKIAYQVTTTQ